jgi:hypothetical protein
VAVAIPRPGDQPAQPHEVVLGKAVAALMAGRDRSIHLSLRNRATLARSRANKSAAMIKAR